MIFHSFARQRKNVRWILWLWLNRSRRSGRDKQRAVNIRHVGILVQSKNTIHDTDPSEYTRDWQEFYRLIQQMARSSSCLDDCLRCRKSFMTNNWGVHSKASQQDDITNINTRKEHLSYKFHRRLQTPAISCDSISSKLSNIFLKAAQPATITGASKHQNC